jgi:hypothetical protein
MKLTIDVDDEFFRGLARAIMDADITRGTAVPPAPAPVPEPAPAPVPPVNPPVTPPNPPEPAPPVVITPAVVDPPVIVPASPHAAFDYWSTSPYCLRADSLREGTYYAALAHPAMKAGVAPDWDYAYAIDAARAIHSPTCSQQLRLQLPQDKCVNSGTYTVITSVFIPSGWKDEPAESIIVSKFLQIPSPDFESHYLEKRMKRQAFGISGGVKVYGAGIEGPGRKDAGSDCAGPMVGPLHVYWDRWTTIIEQIEIGDLGVPTDTYSLWTIDAARGIMQAYDRLIIPHLGPYTGVWIQDGGIHRAPDAQPRYRYWRNVVQLAGAPIDHVLASLEGK